MNDFTTKQLFTIALLRILIGWHLLYEGLVKFISPNWSSYGFLNSSKWIFSSFFRTIAASEPLLKVTDIVNIWGLLLIGLLLILGIFQRTVAFMGSLLLFLYYIAMPPLVGIDYSIPMEGSYMIVNKTLIEAAALLVVGMLSTSNSLNLRLSLQKIRTRLKNT
ncbi:DoxX family membrane protein [Muricauda sp. ANG21]|uniref:DoxX family membrane protein n=1 Tax=Allomuricauda sp. ANG21 TaxID=3042468 RepID=UPI0034551E46